MTLAQHLEGELQHLANQKAEAQAKIIRIEGAEQMCRHLIQKFNEAATATGDRDEAIEVALNGESRQSE